MKKKKNQPLLPNLQQALEDQAKEEGKPLGMPPLAEVRTEIKRQGLAQPDADYIYDRWLGNGYKTGKHSVKNWRAVIRTWKACQWFPSQKTITFPSLSKDERRREEQRERTRRATDNPS
jgi:hypothetical protein